MLDGQTPKGSPMLRKECNTSKTEGRQSEMSRCFLFPCRRQNEASVTGKRRQLWVRERGMIGKVTLCYHFKRSWWLRVGGQAFLFMKLMGLNRPVECHWTSAQKRRGGRTTSRFRRFTESVVHAQKNSYFWTCQINYCCSIGSSHSAVDPRTQFLFLTQIGQAASARGMCLHD